jgi:hypothetical protein
MHFPRSVFPPKSLGATLGRGPPAWFCTTSTDCFARKVQACCILLPILGFTAFLAKRRPVVPKCEWESRFRSPRCGFIPPEEFPSPAAAPCHHGRCPLVVSSSSKPKLREDVDFRALLRNRVRSQFSLLPVRVALSFHGLCSPSRSFSPHPKARRSQQPKSHENSASSRARNVAIRFTRAGIPSPIQRPSRHSPKQLGSDDHRLARRQGPMTLQGVSLSGKSVQSRSSRKC